MNENKKQNAVRIFAPTDEDVRISRARVREIVRKATKRHPLSTKNDYKTMLELIINAGKKE